jgi:diaminopimelate decarboxylase
MREAGQIWEIDFWQRVATQAAEKFGTPCFVCSIQQIVDSARKLEGLLQGTKLRQWLAVKAHPVRDVLLAWKTVGYGAEVVSPFELNAALETGYPPERILA